MHGYEHRTSYHTYMQMGSFRSTQGKGIWRRECPQNTQIQRFHYTITCPNGLHTRSHSGSKEAMGTQDLGLKRPTIVPSGGRP